MLELSVKTRVMAVAILPLVVLSAIILVVIVGEVNSAAKGQLASSEDMFVEAKREEIKDLVELAWTTVRPLYQSGADRDEAVELLRRMSYGKDGYIFGYDGDAIRIFSGSSDASIGKSYYDFKDVNGVYLIRELIDAGRKNGFAEGNHFVTYHFPRLGEDVASPKLSYAIYLPRWNMMIGTGIYIDTIDAQLKNLASYLQSARNGLVTTLGIVALVLAIVLTIVALFLTQSIVGPLSSIGDSLYEIATGKGDLTRRLEVHGKDEVGLVSSHLNALLDSLHRMVSDIKGITNEVSAETESLARTVGETQQVSHQQHEEVDQVASAMTEMSHTSRETAQNANEAAASAKAANKASISIANSVNESCNSMRMLGEDIARTSEVITQVGADVENISAVLQVIESIAEQTNLLALNAAIEAARAGEQGRGFAVVADEVRNLASKTQGSTEEIQQMIAKLQSGSRSAVSVMAESRKRSDLTEASISQTASLLSEISDAISVINNMNSQIATAAEEQSVVGSDISERIVSISNQTNISSEIAAKNGSAAAKLRQKTRELNGIVDRFVL
ncbi:methyl-accepting chemotaxis protein [Teredinibacter turnerae]|uniref:methyl-accepting chemotaxis protein n=1 Tax=Teredinibacter turnerae TaxID=2426 RepID=UPI0005F85434|nr:methyl-accepting chemotaxis protein [Teredinibacter turnerae]